MNRADAAVARPVATVVIRTRNEAASLARVLEEVLAQEGVGPTEVIVIDSGSTDGTLEIARRFPVEVRTIDRREFTYGRALNVGAQLARGPVCVHLSAHCVPAERRWLERLLAPLADASVAASYGRQLPIAGVNPYEEIYLERIFPAGPLLPGAREYFSNANCAVRRALLRERPFDETLAIMEDALWLLDLRPGERVSYVPEAAVFHSHPLRLRYWYERYWRDGVAYRQIKTLRDVELLPEQALRPRERLRALASEFALFARELPRRGQWRHLLAFPLFCALREIALRRGLRHGRGLRDALPHPPVERSDNDEETGVPAAR